MSALRTDQLIGMVQTRRDKPISGNYRTGCAGRIRQYRERKDGRLNVMRTGLCRYWIVEKMPRQDGYTVVRVDWSGFENDYQTEAVDPMRVRSFMKDLRSYFDRFGMHVDWKVLQELPLEQVVNNLVLVVNLDVDSKQQWLLEAATVSRRLEVFSELLNEKADPIRVPSRNRELVN